MLSIDEAIMSEMNQHEFSDYNNYHKQLAALLEELKSIREIDLSIPQHFTKEQSDWIKAYCIKRNIEFYNKAIDDFVNACKEDISCQTFGLHINGIESIAEQLKEMEDK